MDLMAQAQDLDDRVRVPQAIPPRAGGAKPLAQSAEEHRSA
jgi:hypothetical protein